MFFVKSAIKDLSFEPKIFALSLAEVIHRGWTKCDGDIWPRLPYLTTTGCIAPKGLAQPGFSTGVDSVVTPCIHSGVGRTQVRDAPHPPTFGARLRDTRIHEALGVLFDSPWNALSASSHSSFWRWKRTHQTVDVFHCNGLRDHVQRVPFQLSKKQTQKRHINK